MAVTDIQFTDHANQNNAEFGNRRIKIVGVGAPTGGTIAPKYAIYINSVDDQEYINHGSLTTPSWVLYPDVSGKEDVGAAQTELRASVPAAGDTLNKLYQLILSLGSGFNVPQPFDAATETLFPTGVSGDSYIVNVAGTVDGVSLANGDLFWTDTSTTSGAGSHADWYILPANNDYATDAIAGLVELATQAEAEALTGQSNLVVLTALRGWQQILAWWSNTKTTTGKDLSTNDFTTTLLTKLNAIEPNATADQTGTEIETLYEARPDTNKFTDALLTKLTNLFQASEEVTRYVETIVSHTFAVGDPIGINNATDEYVLSLSANDDINHLGFVTAVSGDDLTISLNGLIDITGLGLTAYTRYYLDTDGSLISTDNGFPVLQTITSTKAVIISRGSGGTATGSGASSTPYHVEGVLDGSSNQVDLGTQADFVLVVSLGGDIQRTSQYTIDNSGTNTVIIFEDSAADLNGYAYNIVFINNAVFGDITFDWSQIDNNPIPESNSDITYYLRPSAGGGYELAVLPTSSSPTLQTVTASGAITTLPITVGGLKLSNYSSRTLLYVDTDGTVKQASLVSPLALSAGGALSGEFLPLAGGTVTGNVTIEGANFVLPNIPSGGATGTPILFRTTGTGAITYAFPGIDYILSNGSLSASPMSVANVTMSDLASAGNSMVYVSSSGKFYKLIIGTNLSLDGNTLNASAGTGGVVITGSADRIAKFNAGGNNVIDSQIYDNGTTIGIFTAPIATSAFRVIKSNTTALATFGNTATAGNVLALELPTGGAGTQNFIRGIQGATERFKIDIAGKAWFKNLNIALTTASTQPLLLSSAGNVSVGQIDYVTQVTNKPTIPAAQVSSDWNAISGVSQILNKPGLSGITAIGATTNDDISLSSGSDDVLNFTSAAANANRGIAFNGKLAVSAHPTDGVLRINNKAEFSYTNIAGSIRMPGIATASGIEYLTVNNLGQISKSIINPVIPHSHGFSTLTLPNTVKLSASPTLCLYVPCWGTGLTYSWQKDAGSLVEIYECANMVYLSDLRLGTYTFTFSSNDYTGTDLIQTTINFTVVA